MYKVLTWNETGSVSLRKKKVARRDLFRFESYDLQHHQWVIRTSDNRHLAVDESGSLFVEVIITKVNDQFYSILIHNRVGA